MPVDPKLFSKLSERSSKEVQGTYFFQCLCGHTIYPPHYASSSIKCFKCQATWKLNKAAQMAMGTGENKGVQLLFQKKG
jgi:hypothetical protein